MSPVYRAPGNCMISSWMHNTVVLQRKRGLWASVFAVSALAGVARADIAAYFSPPGLDRAQLSATAPYVAASAGGDRSLRSEEASQPETLLVQAGAVRPDGVSLPASWLVSQLVSLPVSALPGDPLDLPSSLQVKDLPAPPGSMQIALSGLLPLGAWRLMRQARYMHLAVVPHWYHCGCPDQIGHAKAFSLDSHPGTLSLCWYQPSGVPAGNRLFLYRTRGGKDSFRRPQYAVPSKGPRSPPACL